MAPILYESETSSSSVHPIALRSFFPSIPNLTPRLPSSPSNTLPTRTEQSLHSLENPLSSFFRRQNAQPKPANPTLIPYTYAGLNADPPPGEVVGIVFGSVGAFLVILLLIYTCINMGNRNSSVEEEVVVRRRSRSPRRTVSRSRSRSEVIEVRQQSPPRRSPPRRSPPRRSPPRRETRRETVVMEETRRAPVEHEEDIVEVIEEHSPPRRSGGSRRQSGYRTVDPEAFGGGSRPIRKVSRR